MTHIREREDEPLALMIAYWNGCVIAEDDYANLYYGKQQDKGVVSQVTPLRIIQRLAEPIAMVSKMVS